MKLHKDFLDGLTMCGRDRNLVELADEDRLVTCCHCREILVDYQDFERTQFADYTSAKAVSNE
jgi:hypothetical protein